MSCFEPCVDASSFRLIADSHFYRTLTNPSLVARLYLRTILSSNYCSTELSVPCFQLSRNCLWRRVIQNKLVSKLVEANGIKIVNKWCAKCLIVSFGQVLREHPLIFSVKMILNFPSPDSYRVCLIFLLQLRLKSCLVYTLLVDLISTFWISSQK